MAAAVDEARASVVCNVLDFSAHGESLERSTFEVLEQIMQGKPACNCIPACQKPAVYMCGETQHVALVCENHAHHHAGCMDFYRLDSINVHLNKATLRSLHPSLDLLVNSTMEYHGKVWLIKDVIFCGEDRNTWTVGLGELPPTTSPPTQVNFKELRSSGLPGNKVAWTLFCAVADCYLLQGEGGTAVPLLHLHKNPLLTKTPKVTGADDLLENPMDVILQHMMDKRLSFQWLTNMDTLYVGERKVEHRAAPSEAAARDAAPTPNVLPLAVGEAQLGSFRWSNPFHPSARDKDWGQGAGIGTPQLFAGFRGRMGVFGLHEESLGCDFVNILGRKSCPVRWKFIPKHFANHTALQRLFTSTNPEDQRVWYKNVLLSDAALDALGIHDYREIVQQPGFAIVGHQFHQGIGSFKFAEAHSWFSQEWRVMRTWQQGFPPVPGDQDKDSVPLTIHLGHASAEPQPKRRRMGMQAAS